MSELRLFDDILAPDGREDPIWSDMRECYGTYAKERDAERLFFDTLCPGEPRVSDSSIRSYELHYEMRRETPVDTQSVIERPEEESKCVDI